MTALPHTCSCFLPPPSQMTSRACVVCDPHGRQPFRTNRQLQEHLWGTHHRRKLCEICLDAGLRFTLELQAFTPQQMKEHIQVRAMWGHGG